MNSYKRIMRPISLACLAFGLLSSSAYAQQASMLQGRIWDFTSAHPDMETNSGGPITTGQVASTLGEYGKPVWAGSPNAVFSSQEAFEQWFMDVPGVNMSKPYSLELREAPAGSGRYSFEGINFFPIDNELLGNEGDQFRDVQGRPRNFHFTMQLAGEFSYQSDSDEFTFIGDDDLWIFFGGELGIDLGGTHRPTSATITGAQLRELGLHPNQSYPIDIFFAERQTAGSNFSIQTNFNIQPSEQDRIPVGETPITGPVTLLPGENIERNREYLSPNGLFFLTYQDDGNLVIYRSADRSFVWGLNLVAGLNLGAITNIMMSQEGDFIATDNQWGTLWSVATESAVRGSYALLTDEGVLQVRRPDGTLAWASDGTQAEAALTVQASVSSMHMTASQRVSSYMQSHWASAERVDFGYCGLGQGGSGGFGTRAVPTNSHGDVHIFTPDGLAYDFQAGGEFMLVASLDGSVAVQTRQTLHTDDPSVSSNSAVALLVGETVLEFYADSDGQRFYIDGQSSALPTNGLELPGGARIEADGKNRGGPRFIVHWPNDSFSARVNLYQGFLNVGVAGVGGTYSGLIGNLDGNPKNDILPRNVDQLVCPPASGADIMRYGDTWRVSVDETLLRAELRETQEVLVSEFSTGQRVNVETAIYHVLEQDFVAMPSETVLDINIVAAFVASSYNITESAAFEAVTNLLQQQSSVEVSQGITIGTVANMVTTYTQTRESRTIDTLDIERRAVAQRICEANGVGDQLALATCIMDVALTQNEVFVESAQDFEVAVAEMPSDQRFAGSSDYNPMDEQVILAAERVIELVGPPDVVPQLGRRPAVPSAQEATSVATQTTTTNISTVVSDNACDAAGAPDAAALLEQEPLAGGVAVFCATHTRGMTYSHEYGRTLEEALTRVAQSCPAAAEAMVERRGEVVTQCHEVSRAERDFSFGGGQGGVERDEEVLPEEEVLCTADGPFGPLLADDGLFLPFAQDGLQSDFPNRGNFVLVRNEKAGIDVQARRDLWVADQSESVFTALVMVVGQDVIEVHAAPEVRMFINGEAQDILFSEAIELPGGGVIHRMEFMDFEVEWPGTSFAMRVGVYAGSHLSPEIRPDTTLNYQGLARFTSQWMLDETLSGFSFPLAPDNTCACEQ